MRDEPWCAQSFVMAVSPQFARAHGARFIDLAKAQPGKLNYGSTGIGGSNHIVTGCST